MVARFSSARPDVGSVSIPPFATASRVPSGISRTSCGPLPPEPTPRRSAGSRRAASQIPSRPVPSAIAFSVVNSSAPSAVKAPCP